MLTTSTPAINQYTNHSRKYAKIANMLHVTIVTGLALAGLRDVNADYTKCKQRVTKI
jgi:hypothetical protein